MRKRAFVYKQSAVSFFLFDTVSKSCQLSGNVRKTFADRRLLTAGSQKLTAKKIRAFIWRNKNCSLILQSQIISFSARVDLYRRRERTGSLNVWQPRCKAKVLIPA
jgi:hypothetical protein